MAKWVWGRGYLIQAVIMSEGYTVRMNGPAFYTFRDVIDMIKVYGNYGDTYTQNKLVRKGKK